MLKKFPVLSAGHVPPTFKYVPAPMISNHNFVYMVEVFLLWQFDDASISYDHTFKAFVLKSPHFLPLKYLTSSLDFSCNFLQHTRYFGDPSQKVFAVNLQCKVQTKSFVNCCGSGIIIGQYRDGQQPGNCRLQVERIRDYLLQSSY